EEPPADAMAQPLDEQVRAQLWAEGRGIVCRLCPDATDKQVRDLIGSAAKRLGGAARAIQAVRDAEHAAATASIGGDPYRWLWGVVHDRAGTSTTKRADQPATAIDMLRELRRRRVAGGGSHG